MSIELPGEKGELLRAAVARAATTIGWRADVLDVRAGFRVTDGVVSKEPVVVAIVPQKLSVDQLRQFGIDPLPSHVDGVPVDVASATALDLLPMAAVLAGPPRGHNYKKRLGERFRLARTKEHVRATIHLGPDAGWPQLRAFLGRVETHLTAGLFEYTAPHIVAAGLDAAERLEQMTLVIQKGESLEGPTKANDIPDEETVRRLADVLGDKLQHAWASLRFRDGIVYVNPDGIFDSSYHIKVAVRDGKELWLSSGSWQSSNQPPFDPLTDGDESPPLLETYNREWHAIIESDTLATLYEEHLQQDRIDALSAPMPDAVLAKPEIEVWIPDPKLQIKETRAAVAPRYFKPLVLDRVVDIQPVLSPDNYLERVFEILDAAQHLIYFQNQSLKIRKTRPEGYDRLLRTLLAKQETGLDVRIIFRPFQDIRGDLEAIQAYGFDLNTVRLDDKCHTKGIVVDSNVALLGSHNWTNAGTSYNRDASLIFYDAEVARWLKSVFLFDWSRASRAEINELAPPPRLATSFEAAPPGMIKVRLADLDLF